MKTKDIEVGGEYAHRSSKWAPTSRIRVLSVGHHLDSKQRNGVRVQFVGDDGEDLVWEMRDWRSLAGSKKIKIVASREIVSTWDDELERRQIVDEQNERSRARREVERQISDKWKDEVLVPAVDAVNEQLGTTVWGEKPFDIKLRTSVGVAIYPEALLKLICDRLEIPFSKSPSVQWNDDTNDYEVIS